WQILIAILLAALAGTLSGTDSGLFGVTFYQVYDFVGTLFLNALRMIIVPLVMSSIIVGVASLSRDDLGRLGGKPLAYYMLTSTLAILVGLLLVDLFRPGIGPEGPVGADMNLSLDSADLSGALASIE